MKCGEEQQDLSIDQERASGLASNAVPIVAIGSAVGGLYPLEQFFGALDSETGYAFVVIQNLSPEFRSVVDTLLFKSASMPIKTIADGVELEPDVIYLNSPKTDVTLLGNCLSVKTTNEPLEKSYPIDHFFLSLAENRRADAIGVILSGITKDGANGCSAIESAGGTVFIQDPKTTRFEHMPKTAIKFVDKSVVASPIELGKCFSRLRLNRIFIQGRDAIPLNQSQLIRDLRSRWQIEFGFDCCQYDESSITRAIELQTKKKGLENVSEYCAGVFTNPDELTQLYCTFIEQTAEFFRNREAFEYLKNSVLEKILLSKSDGEQIRVWVPGSKSGADAYSLAILINEFLLRSKSNLSVKILATAYHRNSTEFARAGCYRKKCVENIPNHLVNRYFDLVDEQYCVKELLGDLVSFSTHNILRDPPLTDIDLVSCGNSLASQEGELQLKTMIVLHHSLVPRGYLFFGVNEFIGSADNQFDIIDKKCGIYRKRINVELASSGGLGNDSSEHELENEIAELSVSETRKLLKERYDQDLYDVQEMALHSVISQSNTVGLLISSYGELIHIYGNAEKLLPLSAGDFSDQLVDLIHPELKTFVTNVLVQGSGSGFNELTQTVSIEHDEKEISTYIVTLGNIDSNDMESNYQLLCFKESTIHNGTQGIEEAGRDNDVFDVESVGSSELNTDLTQRFLRSKEDLVLAANDLEMTSEALKSSNTELVSTTEELQRTIQELHSVTEELSAVSTELLTKNRELADRNRDIEVLVESSEMGLIHFDKNLLLQNFSVGISELFKLGPKDIGCSSSTLPLTVNEIDVGLAVREVNENGNSKEFVLSKNQRNYLLRVLPFRRLRENVTEGVILSILDISERIKLKKQLDTLTYQFQMAVYNAPNIIARWNVKTNCIESSNHAFSKLWKSAPEEMVGRNIFDLIPDNKREDFEDYLFRFSVGDIDQRAVEFLLEDEKVSDPFTLIIQTISTADDVIMGFQLVEIENPIPIKPNNEIT